MVRAMNVDQSLDDVIKTNRGNRRQNNGGFMRGYSRYNAYAQRRRGYTPYYNRRAFSENTGPRGGGGGYRSGHDYRGGASSGGGYQPRRNFGGQSTGGPGNSGIKLVSNPNLTKMNVSNLEFGVTQGDMRELFGSVGKLKHVALHFDKNGRSQGTCEIIFEGRQDALTAYNQYNGVPLDGRSMLLELMGEPSPYQGDDYRSFRGQQRYRNNSRNQTKSSTEKDAYSKDKSDKTAEDLDKELDAYLTKGSMMKNK